MADKAFALSPISASGITPTDADYDAISEAFMETARGRWFLGEYARRNRNADTAMVLDAVARIERTLAAQKTPAPGDVPDLVAAVSAILASARASAEAALAHPAIDEALAPMRKSARVIREIAWGLRESGADGRICGLLDAQVDAINGACDDFSATGMRDGVLKAFDLAMERIGEIARGGTPMPAAPAATVQSEPRIEELQPAVQEAVAAEAVDAEPSSAPVATPEDPFATIFEESSFAASITGSLGASLLVSGLVAKPPTQRSDPLAPIRRMSTAEKVAFFS